MSVVVITGCSTGLGKAAAEGLAARGDRVYATMRDPSGKNQGLADELRGASEAGDWDLEVLDLDVTSDQSVAAASAKILEASPAPDVVINNAGQMYGGFSEAFTAEEFSRQLDVNVVGIHRVSRAFLPSMRKRGSGLFINVSSVGGRMAAPFYALYNSSKWGVEGYSLGMRYELACTGVDVVVVEPGPFTTELFSQSPGPKDQEGRAATYPAIAHETFEGFGAAFEGMFDDPEVPTDPVDVAQRFAELISMTAGTRPFRSVVGVDLGVVARNASDEAHNPPFLEMMGLTEFVRLKTA